MQAAPREPPICIGVPMELGPIATRGAKGAATSVYFRDPDGSLLEFMAYSPGRG